MVDDFLAVRAERPTPPSKAPSWPALIAALCAVLAFLLVVPGIHNPVLAGTGYLLGALIVPSLVVVYRFGRRRAAQNPFYIPSLGIERLILIVLFVAIAAGVTNAWFVATELAKQ